MELPEEREVRGGELLADPESLGGSALVESIEDVLKVRPARVGAGAPDVAGDEVGDHSCAQSAGDDGLDQRGHRAEVRLAGAGPVALVGPARGDEKAVDGCVGELFVEPGLGAFDRGIS